MRARADYFLIRIGMVLVAEAVFSLQVGFAEQMIILPPQLIRGSSQRLSLDWFHQGIFRKVISLRSSSNLVNRYS